MAPSPLLVENVRKIAVLRANAIGDFIFTLPALDALRSAYPRAEIVLLGLDWHADFLRNRPGPVDRVVVVPPMQGVYLWEVEEDPQEIERFYADMKSEKFDLALQLHGGGRYSNRLVSSLEARLTAGAKTSDAVELDRWIPYNYFHLEPLRYLEIVSLVGAQPVRLAPHLEVTPDDLAESFQALAGDERPIVAVHTGAGDERRRWPTEKFAVVADALARAGARVVIIGTDREADLVQTVVDCMSEKVENLCDRLSLGGLAGLLSRCQVMVSNDSGPLHVAQAVGTSSVGIYWCGNMINAGPVTTARHRTAVSWRLDCPECGANCIEVACGHSVSFVADVKVEQVLDPAMELLRDVSWRTARRAI